MSVADLNNLVVAALKRAMRAKGIEGNASAFTRLLRQEVVDGPDPTTVGRWLKGEQMVPAWALVAASRVSGVAPTDLLLPEADVADLKRVVEGLRAEVAELRSITAAQPGAGRADQDEIERMLAAVGQQLMEAAHELHLPWEPQGLEDSPSDGGARLERLQDRAGLLQARMMEVRAALGLQWSAPRGDADHDAVSSLAEAASLLTQQMGEVRDQLRRRRAEDVGARQRRRAIE